MADNRAIVTNLDEIINSVDICTGVSTESKRPYRYISIMLENGEELKWFPQGDRSLIRTLEQEVELKQLRNK